MTSISPALFPLQTHQLQIELTPDDQPDDRFSSHVNNARYFAFINQTFRSWYIQMGMRNKDSGYAAVMAHSAYDFLRQVHVPGTVLCRISVTKVGRASMEHAVEMWDLSASLPVLAGKGHVVHVGVLRGQAKPSPWPQALLDKCWSGGAVSLPPPDAIKG